jgi:hypothetical protein
MFPGLSEADCQVAAFYHRQLMAEGQHQQIIAGVRPGSAETRSAATTLQQRLVTLLVGGGHHLLGLQAITTQNFDTVPTGKRAAIA